MRPRPALLTVFLVVTVSLAGCANLTGGQPTPDEPTTASTTSATTSTTPQSTIAPAELSDSVAKERALSAEEAYLSAHLANASCLEDWGTTPTTMEEEATVVNRTETGVIVDVTHPYHYSTNDGTNADVSSDARYLVTKDGTTRVSGEDVHPC